VNVGPELGCGHDCPLWFARNWRKDVPICRKSEARIVLDEHRNLSSAARSAELANSDNHLTDDHTGQAVVNTVWPE
jgi:hypothetical protein